MTYSSKVCTSPLRCIRQPAWIIGSDYMERLSSLDSKCAQRASVFSRTQDGNAGLLRLLSGSETRVILSPLLWVREPQCARTARTTISSWARPAVPDCRRLITQTDLPGFFVFVESDVLSSDCARSALAVNAALIKDLKREKYCVCIWCVYLWPEGQWVNFLGMEMKHGRSYTLLMFTLPLFQANLKH